MNSLDYREVIQRERIKLNENYEIPVSVYGKGMPETRVSKPEFLRELSMKIGEIRDKKIDSTQKVETLQEEIKFEENIYEPLKMKVEPTIHGSCADIYNDVAQSIYDQASISESLYDKPT